VSILVGAGIYFAGVGIASRGAISVLSTDERPHVLYLRSFRDDLRQSDERGNRVGESDLVRLLRACGPVIGIGRPGERIAGIGAYRLYVRDKNWQEVAELLTMSARLIVLRGGMAQGLSWELNKVRGAVPPDRVLLFVPFGNRNWWGFKTGARWGEFRHLFLAQFSVRLPEETHLGLPLLQLRRPLVTNPH